MISFPLVGNVNIKASVTNSFKERRLPHALLIEGEAGNGRHTLSDFLAKGIVCEGETVPCGECVGCKAAKNSNHPDITVVAPEENKKNIAVSQIRELKAQTVIKPHMAKSKVFIIDKADTMNEQSQNALLKVLEEPPADTYFILIAENKASFLETVISRCVVLTLSTPETAAAVEYITKTTDYSAENVKEALQSEKNNIGRALRYLEGRGGEEISLAAEEFLHSMFANDMWGMLKACSKAEKNRLEAERFIKELKYSAAVSLRKNTASYKAKALSRLYSELCTFEKSLVTNINLSLLFSALVSKVSSF